MRRMSERECNAVTNTVTRPDVTVLVTPPPTRPDPTRPITTYVAGFSPNRLVSNARRARASFAPAPVGSLNGLVSPGGRTR